MTKQERKEAIEQVAKEIATGVINGGYALVSWDCIGAEDCQFADDTDKCLLSKYGIKTSLCCYEDTCLLRVYFLNSSREKSIWKKIEEDDPRSEIILEIEFKEDE